MAAVTGIWNPQSTSGQAAAIASPKASSASDTGSSSSSSAAISANDFLTLLVTEMKNQDPTAATDPNEYINQLVNVNSLQQLISINQNLSAALGVPPTGSVANAAEGSAQSVRSKGEGTVTSASADSRKAVFAEVQSALGSRVAHGFGPQSSSGNLSTPVGNPAALRVARSLGG